MITNYDGMHSLIFMPVDDTSSVNTWTDWFLVPTSRPTISLPSPRTKFVEIPGMNGSYDLSTYLNNDITYTDRSGAFEFLVASDRSDWITAETAVLNYLHGKRRHVILSDDPDWYYTGRFTVDAPKSEAKYTKISIGYRLSPFKFSTSVSPSDQVDWSPTNFTPDGVWGLSNVIQLNNETKSINIRSITSVNNLTITLPETSYQYGNAIKATLSGDGGSGGQPYSLTGRLDNPSQEANFTISSNFTSLALALTGTGTVRIKWHRVRL